MNINIRKKKVLQKAAYEKRATNAPTRMLPMRILSVFLMVALIMPSFLVLPKKALATTISIGATTLSANPTTQTISSPATTGSVTLKGEIVVVASPLEGFDSITAARVEFYYGTDSSKVNAVTASEIPIGVTKYSEDVKGAIQNIAATPVTGTPFYKKTLQRLYSLQLAPGTYYFKIGFAIIYSGIIETKIGGTKSFTITAPPISGQGGTGTTPTPTEGGSIQIEVLTMDSEPENIQDTTATVKGKLVIAGDASKIESANAYLYLADVFNKANDMDPIANKDFKVITNEAKGAIDSLAGYIIPFNLTGLKPNTKYYYKVLVRVSLGGEDFIEDTGSTLDFTTKVAAATTGNPVMSVRTTEADFSTAPSGKTKVELNGQAAVTGDPDILDKIETLKYSFFYSKDPEKIKEKATNIIEKDGGVVKVAMTSGAPLYLTNDTLEFDSGDTDVYYYKVVAVMTLTDGKTSDSSGEIFSFNLSTKTSEEYGTLADKAKKNIAGCQDVSDDKIIKGFLTSYAERNKKTRRRLSDNRNSVRLAINNYNAALFEIQKIEREWGLLDSQRQGLISGFFTKDITSDEFIIPNKIEDSDLVFMLINILREVLPESLRMILNGIDTSYGIAGVLGSAANIIAALAKDMPFWTALWKEDWKELAAIWEKFMEIKKGRFIYSAKQIREYFINAGVYQAGALAQILEHEADMAIVGTTSIPGDTESLNKGLEITEKSLAAISLFYASTNAIRAGLDATTETLIETIKTLGKTIAVDVPTSSPAVKAANDVDTQVQVLIAAAKADAENAARKSADAAEQYAQDQLDRQNCLNAIQYRISQGMGGQFSGNYLDFAAKFYAIPTSMYIPLAQGNKQAMLSRVIENNPVYGKDVARTITDENPTYSEQTKYTMDQNGWQNFDNSFDEGGWLAYMEQLKPGNNPLSLQLATISKINQDNENLKKSLEEEYQANGGVFSYKVCDDPPIWKGIERGKYPTTVDRLCLKWKTLIPGSTLNAMTNTAATSPWRQLENADETGENTLTYQPNLFTEGVFSLFESKEYIRNEKGEIVFKEVTQ